MNNSTATTPSKNCDDDNDSGKDGMIFHQCQGKYTGERKCTFCTVQELCKIDSKKWW